MPIVTVWHGSEEGLKELRHAVNAHCECGEGKPTCQAHQLLTDQRTLDRLAFICTLTDRLLAEEFYV